MTESTYNIKIMFQLCLKWWHFYFIHGNLITKYTCLNLEYNIYFVHFVSSQTQPQLTFLKDIQWVTYLLETWSRCFALCVKYKRFRTVVWHIATQKFSEKTQKSVLGIVSLFLNVRNMMYIVFSPWIYKTSGLLHQNKKVLSSKKWGVEGPVTWPD